MSSEVEKYRSAKLREFGNLRPFDGWEAFRAKSFSRAQFPATGSSSILYAERFIACEVNTLSRYGTQLFNKSHYAQFESEHF